MRAGMLRTCRLVLPPHPALPTAKPSPARTFGPAISVCAGPVCARLAVLAGAAASKSRGRGRVKRKALCEDVRVTELGKQMFRCPHSHAAAAIGCPAWGAGDASADASRQVVGAASFGAPIPAVPDDQSVHAALEGGGRELVYLVTVCGWSGGCPVGRWVVRLAGRLLVLLVLAPLVLLKTFLLHPTPLRPTPHSGPRSSLRRQKGPCAGRGCGGHGVGWGEWVGGRWGLCVDRQAGRMAARAFSGWPPRHVKNIPEQLAHIDHKELELPGIGTMGFGVWIGRVRAALAGPNM